MVNQTMVYYMVEPYPKTMVVFSGRESGSEELKLSQRAFNIPRR